MSDTTCTCGRPKKPWAKVCFRCYVATETKRSERLGFERGLREGRAERAIDLPRVRTLLQLCHPDKHSGSRAATETTQWLLEMRKELAP